MAAPRSTGTKTAAPARLGPWVLGDVVATRAFTVTYAAKHADLGRRVLLKTLKATVPPSSPFSQELDREAKILSSMKHPAIPSLVDFQRSADAVWLVVEDGGGVPVSEILAKAGRLDHDVVTAIGVELALALGHAHERGVTHRGLRPESVRVTPGGGLELADFTVAHHDRVPTSPEPFEAAPARPDYLAPEQILGEDAGARSDVFALGVVLYELYSGKRPFEAKDDRDLAQRIRAASPAPLRDVAPDVPRAVERVVSRCLAKSPDDRWDDGRAVASALEEAIADLPRPPTRVLLSRALARAGVGEEIPAPGTLVTPPVERRRRDVLRRAVRDLALVGALAVAGGVAIELWVRDPAEAPQSPLGAPAAKGYLRVLATPWAEVLVDGESVDTTPIARPIPLAAGRHFVTFKHPNAPDEKRSVQIGPGQTVLLDIAMRVEHPAKPPPPKPPASVSP